MKLTVFDRKKYIESINKLKLRKAPDYVIRAFQEGYINTVNEYYRVKLQDKIKNKKENIKFTRVLSEAIKNENKQFLNEALSKKDQDFIKAFFRMTNMDIMSGDRLPPNASSLIKQGIVKDFGLKDLFKKLR